MCQILICLIMLLLLLHIDCNRASKNPRYLLPLLCYCLIHPMYRSFSLFFFHSLSFSHTHTCLYKHTTIQMLDIPPLLIDVGRYSLSVSSSLPILTNLEHQNRLAIFDFIFALKSKWKFLCSISFSLSLYWLYKGNDSTKGCFAARIYQVIPWLWRLSTRLGGIWLHMGHITYAS